MYTLLKKIKDKKKKRWWTKKIYTNRYNETFLRDLNAEVGSNQFQNFTRPSSEDFFIILNYIREKVAKQDTAYRKAITPEERLAITSRFLATGDSYSSLQYLFKISKQVISKIVPEVCQAIN